MIVVDFHNHFYPPEYLDAIQSGASNIKVTFDEDNNPLLHYPGDYNIVVPGHRDIAYRKDVLDREGVDTQVLTFTTPGTHIELKERSAELAGLVNDCYAKIIDEYNGRYTALATLPMNDPAASVVELERVVKDLGIKGAMLYSNINGTALSDESFLPLYEKAHELGAVFYIHPNFPVGVEAMEEYWLMPLLGFTFDTTLAAAKLVFSGITEKFPGIKWVLGHLGGTIPYLAERLDRGFHAFKECRENISKLPSEYLKDFYYDTVNFDLQALRLAINFAGVDRLVAGSDYPHQIGSIPQMIQSIDKLDISQEDKAKIYGGNAARLLGLSDK
ncbi:amidohydrolase family protein [candidate division KSB1 bacterium]